MKLSGVEIKKVVYVPTKLDKEGQEKEPATATITLAVPAGEGDELAAVKAFLDFADKGPCTWTIGEVRREMAG